MEAILGNFKVIFPFFAFFWALTLAGTAIWPYKYRNALFLMGALFFTLLMAAGLFGENLGTALLVIFVLCVFALLLVPFMLIFNGIVMLKKEGVSLSHLLSLFIGLGIFAGEFAMIYAALGAPFHIYNGKIVALIFSAGASVFYFSVLLLAFVLYMLLLEIMPHFRDFDYIIIHGCGLRADGSVTKLLSGRLDKAISVYRKSKVKPVLIPSGGQGTDECRSEASAMTEYLISKGIPAESIVPEAKSTTTRENLIFSNEIIKSRGGSKRTALISDNYHVYRCLSIARELKMTCSGIGSRVAFYFWPSAVIREFAAFLSKKRNAITVLIGYAFFVLFPTLTMLSAY